MLVSEIVQRVRAAIDELMVNESDFFEESDDELNLTESIKSQIGYALNWLIENAPQERLEGSMVTSWTSSQAVSTGRFTIDDDLMATVTLPDDILRLVSVRLSSWKYAPIPIAEQSPEFLMQLSRYARGSWDRPVTVLTHSGGQRVLEMYSARNANDTLEIAFVKRPDVSIGINSGNEDVSVPVSLEGALVYEIAGLVMLGYREQVAQSLLAVAKELLVAVPQQG